MFSKDAMMSLRSKSKHTRDFDVLTSDAVLHSSSVFQASRSKEPMVVHHYKFSNIFLRCVP